MVESTARKKHAEGLVLGHTRVESTRERLSPTGQTSNVHFAARITRPALVVAHWAPTLCRCHEKEREGPTPETAPRVKPQVCRSPAETSGRWSSSFTPPLVQALTRRGVVAVGH